MFFYFSEIFLKCQNVTKSSKYIFHGILYKADPDPDPDPDLQKKQTPDLQKKRTLYQNLLYDLKTYF